MVTTPTSSEKTEEPIPSGQPVLRAGTERSRGASCLAALSGAGVAVALLWWFVDGPGSSAIGAHLDPPVAPSETSVQADSAPSPDPDASATGSSSSLPEPTAELSSSQELAPEVRPAEPVARPAPEPKVKPPVKPKTPPTPRAKKRSVAPKPRPGKPSPKAKSSVPLDSTNPYR